MFERLKGKVGLGPCFIIKKRSDFAGEEGR
uniref:Uncharacterized protein n=1 Tax=Rhizophora mucronata TaxID=61149 RepID=A0A2P2JW65_RHIMU